MATAALDPAPRRRRPSGAQFVQGLRLLTLITLPPVAIAIVELGRVVHPAIAASIAVLVLGTVVWGVGPRVRAGFNDTRRAPWIGAIAMPLFDTLWCASLFSPIATGIFALIALAFSSVRPELFDVATITQIGSLLSLAIAAYGVFVRRRWVRSRRVEVKIASLPEALDGYRIAHLSDLHIGSTARVDEARRWVRKANALDADLVAVTGDLVSTGSDFHAEVVDALSALRGRDGVFACLGNHDYYDEATLCARLGDRGVRVLRNEGVLLTRGEARLFVAGVEDAWRGHVDLDAALVDRPKDAATLLLAHNPDLFRLAESASIDLTLSGHTHAGQVAMPFMVTRLGLGTLATKYVGGLFRSGASTLFVHAGLGTTGPAIRIGAAPEIVELVLRRVEAIA